MAVGEALKRCVLGADWRWPEDGAQAAAQEGELGRVLEPFFDSEAACFSIHSLCRRGRRFG